MEGIYMEQIGTSGSLLTVEDETVIQSNTKSLLERRGYRVRQAFTLDEAMGLVDEEMPDCITLDLQMPDGSGLDFLAWLRKSYNVPVLILASKGTDRDVVKGLEAGADDYLTKPYDLDVFLARLAALMRRTSIIPDKIVKGNLVMDTITMRAYVGGIDLRLQQKEFSLLRLMAEKPGEILPPRVLYEKVWGYPYEGSEQSLKVAISKLRSNLASTGYTITAQKGEGYFFESL